MTAAVGRHGIEQTVQVGGQSTTRADWQSPQIAAVKSELSERPERRGTGGPKEAWGAVRSQKRQ
jgi:hypothetical protein